MIISTVSLLALAVSLAQPTALGATSLPIRETLDIRAAASLQSDLKSLGFNVTIPEDSGYSYVSVPFNLRYTIKPAAVAFPSSAQQVSDVVKVAARYNYKVVSRSGGHSYAASGLGGKDGLVVVDLRTLNAIKYDSASTRAVIKPGALLGNVASTLRSSNRALPHGTCPTVGVGGHSAFGGYGFLSRKYGLLLDNILDAEVVLANGTISTVSRDRNSDLFWALRGSAPSFGIVTSITTQTYPMPSSVTVFSYGWTLSVADLSKAINNFQTFAAKSDLVPELGVELSLSAGPSSGRVSVQLSGGFYDANSKFSGVINPLLSLFPKPEWSEVKPGTYQASVDYFAQWSWAKHDTFYAKSLLTPANAPLTSQARDAFANYIATTGFSANTNWFIQFGAFGGSSSKINQISGNDAAFAHRKSLLLAQFYTSSKNSAPPFPAAGLILVDGMVNSIVNNSPTTTKFGAYTNYIDDRLSNWQNLYYADNYSRLQQLKSLYDPNGVFTFPNSIGQ